MWGIASTLLGGLLRPHDIANFEQAQPQTRRREASNIRRCGRLSPVLDQRQPHGSRRHIWRARLFEIGEIHAARRLAALGPRLGSQQAIVAEPLQQVAQASLWPELRREPCESIRAVARASATRLIAVVSVVRRRVRVWGEMISQYIRRSGSH